VLPPAGRVKVRSPGRADARAGGPLALSGLARYRSLARTGGRREGGDGAHARRLRTRKDCALRHALRSRRQRARRETRSSQSALGRTTAPGLGSAVQLVAGLRAPREGCNLCADSCHCTPSVGLGQESLLGGEPYIGDGSRVMRNETPRKTESQTAVCDRVRRGTAFHNQTSTGGKTRNRLTRCPPQCWFAEASDFRRPVPFRSDDQGRHDDADRQ
jgi:hypothetical protein